MLPKTSAYVKSYDGQAKWMDFLIEDDEFLGKYNNNILDQVSTDIKKEFDSKPVYNKEFLKTKIKSHGDEVKDFYNKKIPRVDSNHPCLAVISLDSVLKKDGTFYPWVILKECKYIEKKVVKHITDHLESSCNDSDDSNEEQIKDIKLMFLRTILQNLLFEGVILKMYSEYLSMCSGSVFQNIKKVFFWKNIRNFVILEQQSSISQNIRKYKNFF